MRLAFGFAIALWLSFPEAGLASQQQDPAASPKAPAQAPAAPAPKETAPAESAPAQNSPPETAPTEAAPEKTTTAPAGQAPGETTPAAPANPPAPAPEKKTPDSEAKQKEKMDAGSATEASPPGTSPTGKSPNGTRKRRKRTASNPVGAPRRIVVREGGATEPAEQIMPGMSPAEATRQRQNAEQWLASTDDQLKRLAESTLDARQQDTVGQIRNYMEGARTALQEGDVRRASTLAQKAHLLAEDLVKH
ncbi:MAG: hypothetical protein WCB94_09060 [Terriglobales bacterium]